MLPEGLLLPLSYTTPFHRATEKEQREGIFFSPRPDLKYSF